MLETAKKHFEIGLEYFEKSNFIEAEKNFRKSLEYCPGRLSLLVNLSATLIKLHKFDEAQVVINEILIDHPNDAITHLIQYQTSHSVIKISLPTLAANSVAA